MSERGRKASDEEMLVDFVERLERHKTGRRAVQIHLSQLRPYHLRPHHLRIARQVLEPLVHRFEAAIFQLWNNDLVVLTKGASEDDLDVSIKDVKNLFARDPLFSAPPGSSRSAPFCDWYDVEVDWQALVDLCRGHNEARRKAAAQSNNKAATEAAIGPAILEKLENAIAKADLANILRRQQVFAIIPGAKPAPILTELFFSMPFLAQTVAPGYNVTADKALFQHLARVLDARMLALMPRQDYLPMLKNASLNLSLATVLSQEFLEFDRATNNKDRGPLAIELPAVDYFSDPDDFVFARNFLKERGYKIILDQVKHELLPMLDRNRLDVDLIKVIWSQALFDDCSGDQAEEMRSGIDRFGRERVILCRVDAEEGVEIGQKVGLTLFQGRLLDAMSQGKS
ncbi:EAL domain-containing protein [Dongia mobilis]|uniref:EAL domain-containing protein n=1 Tax=Dongia mobilis TaxID=578943 RepID=A0A4R6WV88_9PROT|nr:EAL domain-containing protein [Dongia mobilis]TDQ83934.1 EAL domain-containing protein [Dongia mobilis]